MTVSMSFVAQRIISFTSGELNTDFLPPGGTKTSFMRAFQVRQNCRMLRIFSRVKYSADEDQLLFNNE